MEKQKFIKLSISTATFGIIITTAASLLPAYQANALSLTNLLGGLSGQNQPSEQRANETSNQDEARPALAVVEPKLVNQQDKETVRAVNDVAPSGEAPSATTTRADSTSAQSTPQARTVMAEMQPVQPENEAQAASSTDSAIVLSSNLTERTDASASVYTTAQISTMQRDRLLIIAGSLAVLGAVVYAATFRMKPAPVPVQVQKSSNSKIVSRRPLLNQ